jgi:hypothetical protein
MINTFYIPGIPVGDTSWLLFLLLSMAYVMAKIKINDIQDRK